MDIYTIRTLSTNYVYLIAEGKQCIVVDPGESKPVLDYLEKKKLIPIAILLTHKHWDHVDGVKEIIEVYDIPVYGGKNEAFTIKVNGVEDSFSLLEKEIKVLNLVGHTLGGVGYLIDDHLFVGDVLFGAGCGYVFEGTSKDMVESLDMILALPLSTKIYPGHEYTERNLRFAMYIEPSNMRIKKRSLEKEKTPTSLLLEKQTNPFLRLEEKRIIERVKALTKQSIVSKVERFAALRRLKTEFDERG